MSEEVKRPLAQPTSCMSRIPGNPSVEGLRRRVVAETTKKTTNKEETDHEPTDTEHIVSNKLSDSPTTMEGLTTVELGRTPSINSCTDDQTDDDSDHTSDIELRTHEEVAMIHNELRIEDESLSDENQTRDDLHEEEDKDEEENEPGEEDALRSPDEDSDEHGGDESNRRDDADAEEQSVKSKPDERDSRDGSLGEEDDESRVPLNTQMSLPNSSLDSDLEVDCVYIPTRVAVAAEHLRETAGHLRESAGHLREQLGEQAGHYREQLGERADQIVQLSGQFREQMGEQTQKIVVQAEKVVHKVKDVAWRVTHHSLLPEWLKDNDYLHNYHRPPLPSFRSCFKSTFRIHTETGNIWTHMLGCFTFIGMMIYFLVTSILSNESWEKIVVYMAFFIGAITCLGCSWLFHTCSCHSNKVAKIFSKLDYSGISLLIVGSFIPWLYFGFLCKSISRWVYIALIIILGGICLMVALKDKFAQPAFRGIRAGLFIALGLSAVIPAFHFLAMEGVEIAFSQGSFGWLLAMGALYIGGALLYAMRIPERFFPGKCDLLVQSHQIFHVMVVIAAFVHYHGLNVLAVYREDIGQCLVELDEEIVPYTPGTEEDLVSTLTNLVS